MGRFFARVWLGSAAMLTRLLYSPFLAQLVVVRRCNLACTYCNEFDKTSEPVPFEVLTQRIDKLKELGMLTIAKIRRNPITTCDRSRHSIWHLSGRTQRSLRLLSVSFSDELCGLEREDQVPLAGARTRLRCRERGNAV